MSRITLGSLSTEGTILRPRSRVAAQSLSPRTSFILASGAIFLALAISLGPTKPDFHLSWQAPAIEIPAIGDFDQQLAQKYFLLPTLPQDGDAPPVPEPAPAAPAIAAAPTAAAHPTGLELAPLPPIAAQLTADPAEAAAFNSAQAVARSLAAQFVGTPAADEVRLVDGNPGSSRRWVALYRRGDRLTGALAVNGQGEIMKYRGLIMRRAPWDDALAFAGQRKALAAGGSH